MTASLILLSVFLSACAGAPLPEYHYYRLNIAAPDAKPAKRAVTGLVLVEVPQSPAVYVPRTIAYSEDTEHLTLGHYHYHAWIDPPARLLQQELARYLAAARIGTPLTDETEHMAPDYRIRAEVRHFERVKTAKGWAAAVALELRAEARTDTRPLLMRNYEQLTLAKDATMEATVEAFSSATSGIFRQFTADLTDATSGARKE